ncbi:hypothetical protein BSKO_07709 [Bryopsis sp. KO-2023]|nr:hypothetical protein BSKO_07709 [Bryopsis sp. KO-2023]
MEAIDGGELERILVTLLCEVYPTGCTTLELARKLGTRANRQYIKKAANRVLYNSALQKGYIVNTGGDPPRWGATPQAVAEFTQQPNGQPMAVKPPPNSAVPCSPTAVSSCGVQPMPMPPEAVRQTAAPPMVVERGSLKQAPAPVAIHYQSEGTDTSPHIQQGFPVGMHPIRDFALQGAPLMVPQAPQSGSLQDQGIIGSHGVMLSNPILSQNLTLAQSQLAPQPLPTSGMYSLNQYSGGELGSSQGWVCVSQRAPVYDRVLGAGQGFTGSGLTGEVRQLTNRATSQAHVDASQVHVVGGMGGGYPAQQGQHGLGCSQPGVGQVGGIPCLPAVHVSKGMGVEKNARPDLWSKPRGKKQVRVDQSKTLESMQASGGVKGTMYSWDNGIKMAGSVGSAVAGLELSRSTGVPSEQRIDRYENVWKDPGLNSREAVDKAGLGGARHVVVERPGQCVQVQSQQSWEGGHPGYNNSNRHDRLDIPARNESAGQYAVGGGGPPGIVLRGNVGQSLYERSKEINGVCSKLDDVKLTWERDAGALYYPESGQLQDQRSVGYQW